MDVGKLITMANQIAAFFAAEPDRKLAIEGDMGAAMRLGAVLG